MRLFDRCHSGSNNRNGRDTSCIVYVASGRYPRSLYYRKTSTSNPASLVLLNSTAVDVSLLVRFWSSAESLPSCKRNVLLATTLGNGGEARSDESVEGLVPRQPRRWCLDHWCPWAGSEREAAALGGSTTAFLDLRLTVHRCEGTSKMVLWGDNRRVKKPEMTSSKLFRLLLDDCSCRLRPHCRIYRAQDRFYGGTP